MHARRSLCCGLLATLAPLAHAGTLGGELAYTSDYIFRGISQGDADDAWQLDLHYTSGIGTFIGAFGSTLTELYGHGYRGELEAYLGQRFAISPSWSTTVTLTDYSYVGGNVPFSNDYQEVAAAASFLDRWTVSLAATPNGVHYAGRYREGRYPAYVIEVAGQLPIATHWFATAGIGHYLVSGQGAGQYTYGNVGVAFEYRSWRVEAGYYAVQDRAQSLFPYGRAIDRLAGTVSWHF